MRAKHSTGALTPFLFSVGLSVLCFLGCLLLGTVLAFSTKDPTALSKPIGFFALLLSAFVFGFVDAARGRGKRPFFHTVLCALFFSLLLLVPGLCLGGGQISLCTLCALLCYLSVAAFAAFLARQKKPARGRRR